MTHIQVTLDKPFRKATIIVGIVLMIIGTLGIVLPQLISITISLLAAWLLIVAGAVVAYQTWMGYSGHWLAWLKPFVLIALGLLIAFHPAAGAAALGLILVVYFLLDGFAGVSLALEMRPQKGWGWMLFNGLLSLTLGVVFLIGWPFNALWLVGLFVGISLFFDGVALLALGLAAGKG